MNTNNTILFLLIFLLTQIAIGQNSDLSISVLSKPSTSCSLADKSIVEVTLQNLGSSKIDSGNVFLSYSFGTATGFDTIKQDIDTNGIIVFTFTDSLSIVNGSIPTTLTVAAQLSSDTNLSNNTIAKPIYSLMPQLPYYKFDFEDMQMGQSYTGDNLQEWKRTPNTGSVGTYMWHVQAGSAPYTYGQPGSPVGPSTGPSGDHTFSNDFKNGNGKYMLIESNLNPPPAMVSDATLELPCDSIDLSNSVDNKVRMSFYYHKFGSASGDLFIDVHDGSQWINGVDRVRGQQQNDDSEAWRKAELSLNQYAGNSNIKIRFRAEFSGRGGDIGIDDIEIFDRIAKDASTVRIIDPESDCELTNNERFRVQLKNNGTDDILESIMGYELTFTPYKGNPIVRSVVKDTAVGTQGFVAPLANNTFEFNRLDMSEPGIYNFKIWTEIQGDSNTFNDTIYRTIAHQNLDSNFTEDWSTYQDQEKIRDYKNEQLPIGWRGNDSDFSFEFSDKELNSAPDSGHTGGLNDLFLIARDTTAGSSTNKARVVTPCIDLANFSNSTLNFWYYFNQQNQKMTIEIDSVGTWILIDSILNGMTNNWTKKRVSLNSQLGNNTRVRLTALDSNGQANFALDDFGIDTTSIITRIDDYSYSNDEVEVKVFPNPSDGDLWIEVDTETDYQIFNLSGQLISKGRLTVGKQELDIRNQEKGVYLLKTIDPFNIKKVIIR